MVVEEHGHGCGGKHIQQREDEKKQMAVQGS